MTGCDEDEDEDEEEDACQKADSVAACAEVATRRARTAERRQLVQLLLLAPALRSGLTVLLGAVMKHLLRPLPAHVRFLQKLLVLHEVCLRFLCVCVSVCACMRACVCAKMRVGLRYARCSARSGLASEPGIRLCLRPACCCVPLLSLHMRHDVMLRYLVFCARAGGRDEGERARVDGGGGWDGEERERGKQTAREEGGEEGRKGGVHA